MLSSTKQVLFSKEISISPSPDDFSEHEKKINTGRKNKSLFKSGKTRRAA